MSATSRINIGSIRREQIVEAAISVITDHGIQALSLSAIEKRAGMARGQLTYYFKTKEDILLAVFDRVLERMQQRMRSALEQGGCPQSGWDWVRLIMSMVLATPPADPEFACLQYTFLAQVGHREDFRRRLASLYEEWRSHLTQGLADDQARGLLPDDISPRAVATAVQALLHGLAVQAAADPHAVDNEQCLHLCLDMLGTYLRVKDRAAAKTRARPAKKPARANGQANGAAGPHRRYEVSRE